MSDFFDKNINDKLNEKQYPFDNSEWERFNDLRKAKSTVNDILSNKSYQFEESNWSDFLAYKVKKQRRPYLLVLLSLLLISVIGAGTYIWIDNSDDAQTQAEFASRNSDSNRTEHALLEDSMSRIKTQNAVTVKKDNTDQIGISKIMLETSEAQPNHIDNEEQLNVVIQSKGNRQEIRYKTVSESNHNTTSLSSLSDEQDDLLYKSTVLEDKAQVINFSDRIEMLDVQFNGLISQETESEIQFPNPNFLELKTSRPIAIELASGIQLNRTDQSYFTQVLFVKRFPNNLIVRSGLGVSYKSYDAQVIDSLDYRTFSFGSEQRKQVLTRDAAIRLMLPFNLSHQFQDFELGVSFLWNKTLATRGGRHFMNQESNIPDQTDRIWLLDQYHFSSEILVGVFGAKYFNRGWGLRAGIEYKLSTNTSPYYMNLGIFKRI